MTTLSKAPLIEVICEIHWGQTSVQSDSKLTEFVFQPEDTDFLFGHFRMAAMNRNLTYIERVNPHIPSPTPRIVAFRFRKAQNIWPCYQIGVGVFTINQVNEGYTWSGFKDDCSVGLECLDSGHPSGLGGASSLYDRASVQRWLCV